MHLGAHTGHSSCTLVRMSRRRLRRKTEKAQRHALPPPSASDSSLAVVREARRVERLSYTRRQAADALGVSRSTFNRSVLPFLKTVATGSGTRLVPVDELKRFMTERRQPARGRAHWATPGRPAVIPSEVVSLIRTEHAAGRSLAQIARDLNATRTPTAHGGAQWWPSTVRAVLRRTLLDDEVPRSQARLSA